MQDHRRIAATCGAVAPIVSLGAVLLATIVASPETFTWRVRALSDMGRPAARTFWLFNGGLFVGGLIGAPFVWLLWTEARNAVERAGVAAFVGSLAGMFLVGVFFLEHTDYYLSRSLHGPAALAFFGLAPWAHWLVGTGAVLADDRRWGLGSIWIGIGHLLAWLGWLFVGSAVEGSWFAVPEMVAALLFGGWVFWASIRLRRPAGESNAIERADATR